MKRKSIIGAGLVAVAALMIVTPASAVSQKVRKACERQAELVRPALRASEKEAYIANCLANATATRRY